MVNKENAVSPVIGVLLMLVVTIIIAAVVSGFAGGLVGGQKQAPSLTMDIMIKNTGYGASSGIQFIVNSLSEPIPTKDIKLITTWTNASGVSGGNITAKGLNYPNTLIGTSYSYQSPLGIWYDFETGNIQASLMQVSSSVITLLNLVHRCVHLHTTALHTSLRWLWCVDKVCIFYRINIWTGTSYDGMMAVLGSNWYNLRPGDVVSIKIMHIPSGKFIFSKDVMVEE